MKLVAFNGFRSDIDRFSTSNEIAQWSRRFFLLPAACSRVSSKRAMWREFTALSRHRFHSFCRSTHSCSLFASLKVPHTAAGKKAGKKYFCAMNSTLLSAAGQKAVRREKVFFLLLSFEKLSNEISSEKGDEDTRTRCVKFHDVEKNLGH